MKFILVSRAFGYPIFLSGVDDISDNRADATVFVEGEDNGQLKANAVSVLFGYKFCVEAA
jgi:hypothetical protein